MKPLNWIRWLAVSLVVSATAVWMGWRIAESTADEPKAAVLSDLRDAVQMADRRGVNVAEIREALNRLERALQQGLKVEPGQSNPPAELLALREAVEAAARKGENVDQIRKELDAVERQLIGRTLQVERPKDPSGDSPQDPNRPRRPPFLPPHGDLPVPPGLIMPRWPGDIPGINRELFDKAQKLREEAFRKLMDNPNDPEALRKMAEATRLMVEAMGGPNLRQLPFGQLRALPIFPMQDPAAHQRPRLGVRMERVPEVLADQLTLEPGHGILITDVLPDTPADKAGFKVHDIVLEFAGKPVPDDPEAFARMVQDVKAGEKVTAMVLRKGKRVELKDIVLPEIKRDQQLQLPDPDLQGANPNGFDFPFAGGGFFVPLLPLGGGIPNGRIVSVTGVNGNITLKAVDNGVQYTIEAVQDDLKPILKISIVDGQKKIEAEEVDKLPEQYRAVVKELIQQYLGFPLGLHHKGKPKDRRE